MNGLGRWSIGSAPKEPEEKDPALELYKLEYEKCATRYDDIYKAIWTHFSYMTIVAGGILTFGGDRIPGSAELLVFIEPKQRYSER